MFVDLAQDQTRIHAAVMTTVCIKYCDIPSYLRSGDFYRALDNNDEEAIVDIPVDCYHSDGSEARDLREFTKLVHVMMFWMLDEIPLGILKYCSENEIAVWEGAIMEHPGMVESSLLHLLRLAYSTKGEVPLYSLLGTNRLDVIRYALESVGKGSKAACAVAAAGNLDLLQEMREEGFLFNGETCATASYFGHLECLQYMHEGGVSWDFSVYVSTADAGHLQCMRYAHEQGLDWDAKVCAVAALSGNLDCLQYAHANGCPWDVNTTNQSALNGHVECLRYALHNGCEHNEDASCFASRNGHMACLELLHEHQGAWSVTTCSHAGVASNITCLKYLHENDCEWDSSTPAVAALKGNLSCLRYALENGCPYGADLVKYAARSGNAECLRYLIEEQGLSMDEEVFKIALVKGNFECVQYLVDQGCPLVQAMFTDKDEEKDIYTELLKEENEAFGQCLELSVERGWMMNGYFKAYLLERDIENCRALLQMDGWFEDVSSSARSVTLTPLKHTYDFLDILRHSRNNTLFEHFLTTIAVALLLYISYAQLHKLPEGIAKIPTCIVIVMTVVGSLVLLLKMVYDFVWEY